MEVLLKTKRPYVICHMAPSIDGRIVGTNWASMRILSAAYERTAETFDADAWIIGRISMEPYAGKARVPRRKVKGRIPRKDFITDSNAESYAIAIDPSGKLTWKSNAIDAERVITVLSERVSDDYLAFLQSRGISYLFGGRADINLSKVLVKLRMEFGIRKLLLEGGGKINGSFLSADLIDELSVLIAPVADGSIGTPTLFDAQARRGPARNLRLISVERLKGDVVWLRYEVRR
jgi:2,5-diamino-6-(ribosylamino)-4(3H)-pyrimidinone 5'-phosphate reductase